MYAGHVRRDRHAPSSSSRGRGTRTRSACSRACRGSTPAGGSKLQPIEGAPREHAQPADGVPVRAALPLRGRRSRCEELPPLERDRARPPRRVLQPGPGRRVAASRARRRRGVTRRNGGGPLVEVDDLKVWFPIKSGLVLDRHVGDVQAVDGVSLDDRRAARRSASSASPAAASRRVGRAILRLYEPTAGRDRLRRPRHHARSARASCGRCAGGCRWSSRTRSPR